MGRKIVVLGLTVALGLFSFGCKEETTTPVPDPSSQIGEAQDAAAKAKAEAEKAKAEAKKAADALKDKK